MTQSDMTSEPQTTPLGALKEWAEKHLSEMPTEPDAEDVLEFEQGDDVAWPEEKLFGQVLTGEFCLCSGDDIVVELHPGDFFRPFHQIRNFDCWQMASQAQSVAGLTKKHSAK